jgi:hypothetical protein
MELPTALDRDPLKLGKQITASQHSQLASYINSVQKDQSAWGIAGPKSPSFGCLDSKEEDSRVDERCHFWPAGTLTEGHELAQAERSRCLSLGAVFITVISIIIFPILHMALREQELQSPGQGSSQDRLLSLCCFRGGSSSNPLSLSQ